MGSTAKEWGWIERNGIGGWTESVRVINKDGQTGDKKGRTG